MVTQLLKNEEEELKALYINKTIFSKKNIRGVEKI